MSAPLRADVHVKTQEDAHRVKRLCDEAGISISSYGSYYRVGSGDKNEWLTLCKNAEIMGAESIRVWLGSKDSEETTPEEYSTLLSDASDICTAAEGFGLLVCPECHDHTYNNNTYAFLRLKSDLGKPNFRTYFQSRYFRKEYDLDRIDKTFDHIINIHVSYRDQKLEQADRVKDETYLDSLLEEFKAKGFSGAVILEFCENEEEFFNDVARLKSF